MLSPTYRGMLDTEDIPRERATVNCAPAYFRLTKGRRFGDGFFGSGGLFGYSFFSLSPRRKLDAEVSEVVSLLPTLFDLFDKGIPEAWLTQKFGYVDKHVMLMGRGS